MSLQEKTKLRIELFKFLRTVLDENDFEEGVAEEIIEKRNKKIKEKFSNITAKTGRYNVPEELFQKRTPRKNRVLISWKTVKENNLTIEQLSTFSGGVTVEFVNNDFFADENQTDPLFVTLKGKLGSNEIVSSIISIRSEAGSSSSEEQRNAYEKLIEDTLVEYNGNSVVLNKDNLENYYLKKVGTPGGIGNEKWEGFIFISIRGGQQDTITSHKGNITLFNPACEYASDEVGEDINLVMGYFALRSIRSQRKQTDDFYKLLEKVKNMLKKTEYNTNEFKGDLLDYCESHPSIVFSDDEYLCDPIQIEPINIKDFSVDDKNLPEAIDFTHSEAVFFEKYYWDEDRKQILSPSRPTNVFWSKHLSNMMQQNFTLDDYFKEEYDRVMKRQRREL